MYAVTPIVVQSDFLCQDYDFGRQLYFSFQSIGCIDNHFIESGGKSFLKGV